VSTRETVLATLRSAMPDSVSGQTLAEALGVSRAAIGKHVSALRRLGYVIDPVPGRGYRLIAIPDAPLPSEIEPLLVEEFWVRLEGGGPAASTMADAKARAEEGAPEGTVVLADRQSAGRGRFDRTWASPLGGAYFSAVLRPDVAPADLLPLPLVIALGVAQGLEDLGLEIGLKWPNDVRVDGQKVAGILVDLNAEADRARWVVAGVGVNVRHPEVVEPGAVYLEDLLEDARIPVVAAAVLDGIARAYGRFRADGLASLVEEYGERLDIVGREVTVRDAAGSAVAVGTVTGVARDGRLLLDSDDGVREIASGEVTLARP
jgi:BirA family biotin operon repressor/biotin-[acetyl-CoA-carboxylase] ligase